MTETAADYLKIPLRKKRGWLILTCLWGMVVMGGSGALMFYSLKPGEASPVVPTTWPATSRLPLASDEPTLVMFAHPKCPCTRASIGELETLMARVQGKVKVRVVFFRPEGVEENWAETDLWRSAAAIPGVEVQLDADGREAREFQASTSGHVVLYDSKGRLLFRGGITEARGHRGDNAGRGAITDLLQRGQASRDATATFGCPLQEPAPAPLSRSPGTDS